MNRPSSADSSGYERTITTLRTQLSDKNQEINVCDQVFMNLDQCSFLFSHQDLQKENSELQRRINLLKANTTDSQPASPISPTEPRVSMNVPSRSELDKKNQVRNHSFAD